MIELIYNKLAVHAANIMQKSNYM